MTIESKSGHEAMNTQQATGIHLRQLFNVFRRRWKLIIVTVVVAAGLAGIIGLVFPPRYTATAEVIVDPPRSNGSGELGVAGVLDDAAVQTHVAALLSQSHLKRVFDSVVAERGPGPKETGGLLGPEEFDIDNFTKRINAFKDTHSRMIGITYLSTDPRFAAVVANRSVELYLATLTERNIADRNDALRSLSKSIPRVKAEVEHADAALQSYRIKHGLTEISRTDMVDQQLVDLNRQLAVARSTFAQLYDSLVQREKAIFGEGGAQPDVRVLSSAYVPTLPSSLNSLLFIPPAMVLALIGAGLVAVLLEQLDTTLRTERDVTDTLGISCIGGIPQFSRKRHLRPHQLIPHAARYAEAIRSVLARALRRTNPPASERILRPQQLVQQDARYAEAVRSVVAAALQLTTRKASPKTFFVTSSVPEEGKTTLAISFAVYAAQIHRRVLLIDLSFRHPSIARELGEPADNGILHVLRGGPVAELIRAAPRLGFDYLGLSGDSEDPVATLAGELVPKLLRELRGSYDCVVIDGAPLLSATEARLLASMVDKVLFAVKWGSTPREVAQNALELLRRSAPKDRRDTIAAVITQIDLEKHARYCYGDFSENLLHVQPNPA